MANQDHSIPWVCNPKCSPRPAKTSLFQSVSQHFRRFQTVWANAPRGRPDQRSSRAARSKQPPRWAAAQVRMILRQQEAQMTNALTVPQQASSTFAPMAAAFQHLTARLHAGLTAMSRRQSERRELASFNEVRAPELHRLSRQSATSHGGLFDPRYAGLSAHAHLDAGICRRTGR
jgi:hypothetical protein